MSKIIIRIGFVFGLINLIIYAMATYIFGMTIETYRWIITATSTTILGIYTWKQIKQKK